VYTHFQLRPQLQQTALCTNFNRKQLAAQFGVMPYHIIGGKETLLLAQARPDSMQQLRRVPGISDHQLKQYGKQILAALQQVCSELNLSTNQPLQEELQRVEPTKSLQIAPKGQPEGLSKAESEVLLQHI
jgi:HRDC domain